MKPLLRKVHKYLALALAVFWITQALTGLLMVFRWELEDAVIEGPAAALDTAALGARIDAIDAGPGNLTVTQLYATGGLDGRFDLYVDDANEDTTIIRVDGTGHELRQRASGTGFIPIAADVHQTLLSGEVGKWIVGLSGAMLVSVVVMGLVIAWPRRNQWRAVLRPRGARPGAARRYAWHRAVGLWLAIPATVLLTAGVLLRFETYLLSALGLDETPPELASAPALPDARVPPGRALDVALARFPGSELSGARMPTVDSPWYRIRVRQPEEWRRVYGTTVVYVSAADARILRVEDALDASRRQAFMSNLYPIHTGEAGGLAGRLLSLATGTWLLAMLVLGLGLWWARRRPSR